MKFLLKFFLFILFVGNQLTFSQSWMPVNNPGGGEVTDLFVHSSGEILAGTQNGPFSSDDGGQTWASCRGNIMPRPAAPVKFNSLGHMFWQAGFALYRSTDNGATWIDLNNGTWPSSVGLEINANDDIFVSTNSNIWRSTDNGSSWTPLPIANVSALGVSPQQELYAGSYSRKIYHSVDNGDTWELVYTDSTLLFTVKDFAFDGLGNVYSVIREKGILKSTDGGNSWHEFYNSLLSYKISTIAVNSNNDIFIGRYGNDGGVYSSIDGGNSWLEFSTGLIDSSISKLAFLNNGVLLAGTSAGGVFRREPGGNSWTSSSTGLMGVTVNLLRARSDGNLFAAASSGVYRSSDGAISWTWSKTGFENTDIEELEIHDDGSLYAAAGYKIYRSTDDGSTWNNVTSNLPNGEVVVQAITFNSFGDVFLATSEYGITRSTNNGQSWTYVNNGLPDPDVRTLVTNSNDILFASDGISTYRSTNTGQSWVEIINGLTDTDVVEFAVGQNDVLFGATYSDGVFRSTDNGDNWTLTLDTDINSMSVNGSQIYAGSNVILGGVYHSADNGLTWTLKNDNLPSLQIESLAYRPGDKLFALIRDNGIYANDLTSDINNFSNVVPTIFSLGQNYPNPFNPSTTIQFALPQAAFVRLEIFNVVGERVDVLVSQELNSGQYSYKWNGLTLTSGVYFYRLNAGNFVETRKMMLLK